jgi:hypothetical protein
MDRTGNICLLLLLFVTAAFAAQTAQTRVKLLKSIVAYQKYNETKSFNFQTANWGDNNRKI